MNRIVVVTSISGLQQAAVASAFDQRGWSVRGTGRSAGRHPSGETAAADLETGAGLADAFAEAAVVAFTLPQVHRPGAVVEMARNVARAAAEAGVGRLVLNVASIVDERSTLPLFADMRAARDAVRDGRTPSVVLQPTVYMENLLAPWNLPSIVNDGVLAYPVPEDAPVSWISHRGLADFVIAAAEREDAAGREFLIGGPEALTGTELARRLGERLDRSMVFRRVPLDGLAAGLDEAFGPPAGDRIASLYARLDREPDAMETGGAASNALGVKPESFAAFAARHDWRLPELAREG